MIRRLNHVQRRSRVPHPWFRRVGIQLFANRLQQFQVRQLVPRPLQKQHRHTYFRQMLGPLRSRRLRRMQRKSKKHDPSHSLDLPFGRRLRSHPPSHRFSTRQQRQFRSNFPRCSHRRRHRRRQHRRLVRHFPPLLHIRKLIPQRRHSYPRQFARQCAHKRMPHPRARSMPQHQQPFRVGWPHQNSRDALAALHFNSQFSLCFHFWGQRLPPSRFLSCLELRNRLAHALALRALRLLHQKQLKLLHRGPATILQRQHFPRHDVHFRELFVIRQPVHALHFRKRLVVFLVCKFRRRQQRRRLRHRWIHRRRFRQQRFRSRVILVLQIHPRQIHVRGQKRVVRLNRFPK